MILNKSKFKHYFNKKNIILMLIVVSSFSLYNCDDGSVCQDACFVIDINNPDCRINFYSLQTATLNLNFKRSSDGVLIQQKSGTAAIIYERRIKGTEINYGFWSKNAHRDISYDELFEWKYGRKPDQNESNHIPESTARQWFNEKYAPRTEDVSSYYRYTSKFCNYPDTFYGETIDGVISFADGTKCELEPKTNINDISDCPRMVPLKVKKGCSKCGVNQ